ncbi:hypothetical protein HF675_12200 [Serratia sp. JUb9]|uniref:hypothetical protein n=1 Tax=Serratia sp. JUb9 TaxID=2724469 RepID=UPI000DA36407|nr:hypothetical protein [Serratia sp. JUb9]MBU3892417.1 hypothetical protein [Serratia rubidaea]MCA4824402.1 hypothetical protein [Serratia rubidaea]QNK30429.1 hypothetical protein HF675_12200 [Serratia sp. JUb9]SQJ19711.1 Uncharacterised protein [Serratia rubidaea]
MIISIFVLLYAILMISVGINEIYFSSTGESEFFISLLLTFSGTLVLLGLIWRFVGRRGERKRHKSQR